MHAVVECVPNFSEGRDRNVLDAIVRALLAGPEVYLLDCQMDADHNRSVVTIVGTRESIGPAALRGMGKAAELIDLNRHQGAHPRLGATDVVPFVPVDGATLADCVHIAIAVAEEAWRQFKIPTYLYEAAARTRARVNLENIRRGQFEGLREEVRVNTSRRPDFGGPELHATAGATVVGARNFLIAYNINLNTPDVAVARSIAKKIRASSGGLPCVKAMGVDLRARNLAQVSMNLTDFKTTSVGAVFEAVSQEAAAAGVGVSGSEIVGLVPRRALIEAAACYLRIENFEPELILENRLEQAFASQHSSPDAPLRKLIEEYVRAVAASTPTPGGGSAAALAGALAAALGQMVCGVSLKRKSFSAHHTALEAARARLAELGERLMIAVDRDPRSYEALMCAVKLPKSTEIERTARDRAIEASSKDASIVPLETAEIALAVAREIRGLVEITIPQAASDLRVALNLAETARRGGIDNVLANLSGVHDPGSITNIRGRLAALDHPPDTPLSGISGG
jgi:glutamate formiminotransferase/formiminotetrahydrofolate cyclodeaminase